MILLLYSDEENMYVNNYDRKFKLKFNLNNDQDRSSFSANSFIIIYEEKYKYFCHNNSSLFQNPFYVYVIVEFHVDFKNTKEDTRIGELLIGCLFCVIDLKTKTNTK